MTEGYNAEADGITLRHGNFGVRFVHEGDEEQEYGNFCYLLIDTRTGGVLGWDGGEPEDQLLVRDWKWVPYLLDKVERQAHEAGRSAGRREGIEEAAAHLHTCDIKAPFRHVYVEQVRALLTPSEERDDV